MRMKTIIGSTLMLALFAAACEGSGPASGSGATVVEDDNGDDGDAEDADAGTDETAGDDGQDPEAGDANGDEENDAEADNATDDEAEGDAALGTRDNPLALGTQIEFADWTVTVTDVDPDATDEVLDENQFNDPPADGEQFVMFSVEATYEGEESGSPMDFRWAVVGAGGNTFDDRCGSIPASLSQESEAFPGATITGNVCYSVAQDQIDGGTIRLEELFSFEDTRAFFALN